VISVPDSERDLKIVNRSIDGRREDSISGRTPTVMSAAQTPRVFLRSVGSRVLAGFLVVTLVTIAVGVVGMTQLSNLNSKAGNIYSKGAAPAVAVQSLESTWYQYTDNLALEGLVTTIGKDGVAAAQAEAATLQTTIASDIAAIDKMPLSASAAAHMKTMSKLYNEYLGVIAGFTKIKPTDTAGMANLVAQSNKLEAQIPPVLQAAAKSQLDGAAAQNKQADSAYSSARTLIIVLLLVGLALSATLALLVARSVIRPVRRTQHVLEGLEAGDLSRRVEIDGSDELAQMGRSLNAGLESMGEVVRLISNSASGLSAASNELSGVATAITDSADTAAVQASAVTESANEVSNNVSTVATGADEMSASIHEISVNAAEAATVAAEAMTIAEMTTETVTKLGDSSAEIGDVIKVITSIAEQTNLLALNATIEAARAGEAGKGFAVVASEVKDLAQETARATEDISGRVAAIQSDTAGAVEAISRISEVIQRMHDFQATIASAVEEQNATTNEIGRNVGQAASRSAEIAQGIAGVASAAQDVNTGARASREAATRLSDMSNELHAAVGRFTV